MQLCTINNITMAENCSYDITNECSVKGSRQSSIYCDMSVPFGHYMMRLTHLAPWVAGDKLFHALKSIVVEVDHTAPSSIELWMERAGGGFEWWWGLGGAGALVMVGLAVGSLALSSRKRRQKLWSHWPETDKSLEREAGGAILLLYARDCPLLMRAAAELRSVLRWASRGSPVYDMFAADTWREIAAASGTWVARAVAAPHVRLVLLQTPAARLLYAPPPAQHLKQPLLGRSVVYRRPHAADELVRVALRTVHEVLPLRSHELPHYRKCYKCIIPGLEADVAPTITPFREYELPGDVLALLSDLEPALLPPAGDSAPRAPPPPALCAALDRLAAALHDLRAYVADHPDYLDDELIHLSESE
ncbi:uncharacterized protein LOC126967902 isoform X2 [Leptidea sinapis]|nr:uncharacterized protein LOC126967902 isoform X2 [Leptidea sinapis]